MAETIAYPTNAQLETSRSRLEAGGIRKVRPARHPQTEHPAEWRRLHACVPWSGLVHHPQIWQVVGLHKADEYPCTVFGLDHWPELKALHEGSSR